MGISSWFGSRGSAERPGRLRRWVMPTGRDDPESDEIKRAAAADIAAVEEDAKYFRPRSQEDDL
jgi:hypothetical protein